MSEQDYFRIDDHTPVPPAAPRTPPTPPGTPPSAAPVPPGQPMMPYLYPYPPPQQPAPRGFMSKVLGSLGTSIAGIFGSLLILPIIFLMFGFFNRGEPAKVREEVYRAGDNKQRVALIPIEGMIDFPAADRFRVMLEQAAADATVKAVVLSINSPGGYVTSSDEMYQNLKKFRKESGKPVVVHMRGVAASGGYYVAVGANHIVAEPSTITGSIGVVAQWFGVDGLMKEWKIESKVFRSGDRKYRGGPFEAMDEKTVKEMEDMLAYDHKLFVSVVAEGRKLPVDKVDAGATGAAFHAREALDRNLIDEIGYQDDAVAHAVKQAGLTGTPAIVLYRAPFGGIMDLLGATNESVERVKSFDASHAAEMLIPRRMYLSNIR